MTSIQGLVPNKSKSEKWIILYRSWGAPPTYGNLPLPQGSSGHLSQFLTSLHPAKVYHYLIRTIFLMYVFHRIILCKTFFNESAVFSFCEELSLFLPTSLWLPPVFSSCRFSPAGMSYFSHSWRGPSSELPGHCRLSAHSPQHTAKNGEFPLLWSSSFFKIPQHPEKDIENVSDYCLP